MILHLILVDLSIGLAVFELLNDVCADTDLVFLVEEGQAEELDVLLARGLSLEGVVEVYVQLFEGLRS